MCYINSSSFCFAVLSNEFFPKFTSKIITITPLIGVILTTLLCASPVSLKNLLSIFSWRHINDFSLSLTNTMVSQFISFYLKIGQVADVLKSQGAQLILPVAALHAAAFFLGYQVSKFSFGESTSRTISIECGMQVVVFLYFLAYQWTNLCSHYNTCLVFSSLLLHVSPDILSILSSFSLVGLHTTA